MDVYIIDVYIIALVYRTPWTGAGRGDNSKFGPTSHCDAPTTRDFLDTVRVIN